MFCTECGTKVEPNTAFCTNCGSAAGDVRNATADTSVTATTRQTQNSVPRHWTLGAVVVASVVLLAIVAYRYSSDGSSSNVQSHFKLPGGKSKLTGKWYRVTELQLGESEALPFFELFKDNTLLHSESRGEYKGRYPGTWTDLEDGRVKMELTSPLGTKLIAMGKVDRDSMSVESEFGGGTYVNGLEQAKEYVQRAVHPTVDAVMVLIDRADERGQVSRIRLSGKPGVMEESGMNCKDYTARVEYTVGGPFGLGSRNVEGFVCLERNEKGVFKLAGRKLTDK